MTFTITPEQKQQYQTEGYLVLRDVVPSAQIQALRAAISDVIDASIAGEIEDLVWIDKEQRLPSRLSEILRPQMVRPAFAESLATGPYVAVAGQLLESPVRYSLFGAIGGGGGYPYIQDWHRDLVPTEVELPVLERGFPWMVQTNAPLYSDRYLTIIPGSHLRATTAAESAAYRANPAGDMPEQITVCTEPGDVAFYYPNLWHRGYNPTGEPRFTMHHAFWRADLPVLRHEGRQNAWIATPGYLETLPTPVAGLLQRYLDAYPATELVGFHRD